MPRYEKMADMLTTGEVARLLDVHVSTVRRWSNRGLLKSYRVGPRSERRFRRDDITVFFLEWAVRRYTRQK